MASYKTWLKDQKKKINKNYDKQVEITKDSYNEEIDKAGVAYEGLYRQNEVDRIANQKRIAEVNANLGLTNSGLNRTQQTAVQLSYANRGYDISKTRQQNIDDLAFQRSQAVKEINLNRQNAIAEAEDQAETMKTTAARTYSGGSPKTVSNNNASTFWSFDGIDEKTGKYVFSDGNGKKKTIAKGVNPYTGAKINSYGFDVWNGYQPKGVQGHGAFTKMVDENGPWNNGHQLRVWQTGDGKNWVWDDYLNGIGGYIQVEYINGQWLKVL